MKYNVYIKLDPIYIEGIEANSAREAEDLATAELFENIYVTDVEVTKAEDE